MIWDLINKLKYTLLSTKGNNYCGEIGFNKGTPENIRENVEKDVGRGEINAVWEKSIR